MHRRTGLPRLQLAVQNITVVSGTEQHATSAASHDSAQDQSIEQIIMSSAFPVESENAEVSTNSSIILTALAVSSRCAAFCPCRCHIRNRGQTPAWLRRFFGVLFFQYSGTPLLNRRSCDFHGCKPYGGSARCEYRFPVSFLPWMLCITASWNSNGILEGNWSLRTPEYIPESAYGIFNIVERSGSSQQLEKALDLSGLSAWAALESDGRTILDVGIFRSI